MGRATQGVKLIDLTKRGDVIASVCKVSSDPEEVPEEAEEDAVSTIKAPVDDANADAEVRNEAIDEVDETEEVQSSIFDEETLRKIEEPQDDSENKE
jgi:DNA gyrase subunit A